MNAVEASAFLSRWAESAKYKAPPEVQLVSPFAGLWMAKMFAVMNVKFVLSSS